MKTTEAPTNETAMGMKTIDLAMLPQAMRSVSSAIRRPNAVHVAGTTISHNMLLRIPSQNFVSLNIC